MTPKTSLLRFFFLAATFLAFTSLVSGCSSDSGGQGGGGGGDFEVKLRRIEVAEGGLDTLDLTVIALVRNPTSSDLVVSGGEIQVKLAGRPERLKDGPAADAEGGEEEETSEGDAAGDDEGEETSDDDAEAEEEAATDDDEGGDAAGEGEEAAQAAKAPVDTDPSGIVTDTWVKGTTAGGKVPAGAEAELPYTVSLPLPDDPDALLRLLTWELVDVAAKGTAVVGGATETFEGTREVRLPLLPEVKLEAQVGRVDGGREGQVFFHLTIYNPNGFPLVIDRVAYSITVAGKELKPLDEGHPEEIPAGAERPLDETIKLNDEVWGGPVQSVLRQPSVPYVLKGVMVVRGVELPIDFSGSMEFPR